MINERDQIFDVKELEMNNPQESLSLKPSNTEDPISEANFSVKEMKKRARQEQKVVKSALTSPRSSSPVPIINEFSDQSHRSRMRPKREKKSTDKKHLKKKCESFLDVGNIGLGFESLFSENATAFALHHSANNMHFVNMSLKNQVVTLKNQVNQLSYDNQRISRQNKMLLLERERLLTTIQNSSLLMRSTVSSICPKVEDTTELVKRKNSIGSKNESEVERGTKCTIKEFDNLLTTLQSKEETRKLKDYHLYLDEEPATGKSRLKSVSQYDVIVKWLNNDENSDEPNSKDDESSKEPNSRDDDENSSKESSIKNSSSEEAVNALENEILKENLDSIKSLINSIPNPKEKSVLGSVRHTPLPMLRQSSHLGSVKTTLPTPFPTPKQKSFFSPFPTIKEKSLSSPFATPKEKSVSPQFSTLIEKSTLECKKNSVSSIPTPKQQSQATSYKDETPLQQMISNVVTPVPLRRESRATLYKEDTPLQKIISNVITPIQSTRESHASPCREETFLERKIPSVTTPAASKRGSQATPCQDEFPIHRIPSDVITPPVSRQGSQTTSSKEKTPHKITSNVVDPMVPSTSKTPSEKIETKEQISSQFDAKSSEKSVKIIDTELDSTLIINNTTPVNESRNAEGNQNLENMIFGESAVWMELDEKPQEEEKTEFLQNWLDDLKDKTRKFAKSCKSNSTPEQDKKVKNAEDMEHMEFIHLCNEMIQRMDSLIPKDAENHSRRSSKSHLIMNFLLNKNNSLNLKYSPRKETCSNEDTRSVSNVTKEPANKEIPRDLLVISPVSEPPLASEVDTESDRNGWKAFYKCLKDLEEVNVRRTNDAIRQTMVVRALRKLLAKQCNKISKNNTYARSPNQPAYGPNYETVCSKSIMDREIDDNFDKNAKSEDSPKMPTASNSVSSKENNRTPEQSEASFYRIFSNASKSIYLNNMNFDHFLATRNDRKFTLMPVPANKSRYNFRYDSCIVSSNGRKTALTQKSKNSNKCRSCSRKPNVSKISTALKRIQNEQKDISLSWVCIGLIFTMLHIKVWRLLTYFAPFFNFVSFIFNK